MTMSDAQKRALETYDKKTSYERQRKYIEKMRKSGAKHSVYFSMDTSDYEALKARCAENGVSVAETLRTLANNYTETGAL